MTLSAVQKQETPAAAMKSASGGKGRKDRFIADEAVVNHLALIFITAEKGLKRAGIKSTPGMLHVASEEASKMLRHQAPQPASRAPVAT